MTSETKRLAYSSMLIYRFYEPRNETDENDAMRTSEWGAGWVLSGGCADARGVCGGAY
jgi:hypothetical protein